MFDEFSFYFVFIDMSMEMLVDRLNNKWILNFIMG